MRVLVWADHPGTTTGFRNASVPFVDGFMAKGWRTPILGRLSLNAPDPPQYEILKAPIFDQDAVTMLEPAIYKYQPDILWVIGGPGSLRRWIWAGDDRGLDFVLKRINKGEAPGAKPFKVVAYMPIEGQPLSRFAGLTFDWITETGGKCVFYSQGSLDVAKEQFPDCNSDSWSWVHHGLDHINFRQYPEGARALLREMTGLSEKFLVGSVGANKSIKGFADFINIAVILKEMGRTDINFYLHTEAEEPLVGQFAGHDLKGLADHYDVRDTVLFKPKLNTDIGNSTWVGIPGDISNTVSALEVLKSQYGVPTDPYVRGEIFANYGYIDVLNMFDAYLDLSRIEGWGFPMGEAMACGVPVLGVEDHQIRDEVYSDARYPIAPYPPETWDTNHGGARMARADPACVAQAIIKVVDDDELRQSLSLKSLEVASRYKWITSIQKMIGIMEEVHGNED